MGGGPPPDSPAAGVGVVIPVYNQRPYVARAVQSVLRQTYRDFSLVVVDDGSTDGSADAVREIDDSRITVITGRHLGPGAARNRGLRACDTTWVGLLDADDEWAPSFLSRTIAATRATPDVTAVFTGLHVPGIPTRPPQVPEGLLQDYFRARLRSGVGLSPSSVLLHRDAFLKLGGFREDYLFGDDTEAWLRLACLGRLYWIPEPLGTHHVGVSGSLTGTVSPAERATGLRHLLASYASLRRAGKIPATLRASCRRFVRAQRAWFGVHLLESGQLGAGMIQLLASPPTGMDTLGEYRASLRRAARALLVRFARHRGPSAPGSPREPGERS